MTNKFTPFPKIARWSRSVIITEKLDGTNACVWIGKNGDFRTASRSRWITPQDDNYGFSQWAHENKEDLLSLGVGGHSGEWWGHGIQRGYNQTHKKFSLFNTSKWNANKPECCDVVPTLYQGILNETIIHTIIEKLRSEGSKAAPGFMDPEGIVIWHEASRTYFKKTLKNDEAPKGKYV